MSNSDESADAQFSTTIPQDTTGDVFAVALGLTWADIALIGIPLLVELLVFVAFLRPAEWMAWTLFGTFAALYVAVTNAPPHLSPRETVAAWIGTMLARVRMPLVGDAARDVPGAVDVHPDLQAVERGDGALAAAVRVEQSNHSQVGEVERLNRALALANALDSKLSKTNTPAKVVIRRRDPDPSGLTDGLDTASRDGETFGRGARAFAADRAAATVSDVADHGVMDVDVFVATWVHPAEVSESPRLLDSWAHSRFVRPSTDLRDAQADTLDRRVGAVLSFAQTAGAPTRLDADATVAALRAHWRDDLGPAYSATTYDGTPDPAKAGDSSDSTPAGGGSGDANPGGGGLLSGIVDGVRRATSTSRLPTAFAPATIHVKHKSAEIDDRHATTLWVTGWPKYPGTNFLAPLLETEAVECEIALFVGPTERQEKMDELADRANKADTEGSRDAADGDNSGAGDAARYASDIEDLRDHMRDSGVDASDVSAYITVRAESEDVLTECKRDVTEAATEAGVDLRVAAGAGRQVGGLIATSPVGGDRLFHMMRGWLDRLADSDGMLAGLVGRRTGTRTRTEMPPEAFGVMLPFGGQVRTDADGVIYGMATSATGRALGMLQIARDRLTAPHRYFVGRSGSGKTFRETVGLIEELIRHPGRRLAIIDIAENFDGVVELFGGEKVTLGETTINPWAVSDGVDLDSQVAVLRELFTIYLQHNAEDGVAERVTPTLDTAIRETYREVEIYDGGDAWRDSPTMHTFFDTLRDMNKNPEEYTLRDTDGEVTELKEDASTLLSRFRPLSEGEAYDFLVADSDHPDDAANLSERVVLYDMSKYKNKSGAEKGMLTMLVLTRAFGLANDAGTDTDVGAVVAVDEAHDLFADTAQADRLETTVRAGRNAGLAFDFLSQTGEDFDGETAGIVADQAAVSVWGNIGGQKKDVARAAGWSEQAAASIAGGLATGDNKGTDYSEAMVDVESGSDQYRTRFEVGPVVKAVATYDADTHGDFDAYLDRAIRAAADEHDPDGPDGGALEDSGAAVAREVGA